MNKPLTEYILREVSAVSHTKYTTVEQQLHYQIGFLAAQLANTFLVDSKNRVEFKTAVESALYPKAPLRNNG